MDVTLALLADAANISKEGKLNVLGIFNIIYAQAFPAVHPSMHLVLSFETNNGEAGRVKEIEIAFFGPDDNKTGSVTGKFKVPRGEPGYPVQMNHILPIPPIRFEKQGDYSFRISVNGDFKKSVSLRIIPAKTSGN